MTIQTRTPDGVIHQFPDGTPQAAIDKAMKAYAASNISPNNLTPGSQPGVTDQPWRFDPANRGPLAPRFNISTPLASLVAGPVGRAFRDVGDPVLDLAQLGGQGTSWLAKKIGGEQNPVSKYYLDPATQYLGRMQGGLDILSDSAKEIMAQSPGYQLRAPEVAANVQTFQEEYPNANYALNAWMQRTAPIQPALASAAGWASRFVHNIPHELRGEPTPVTAGNEANVWGDQARQMMDQWQQDNPKAALLAGLSPLAGGMVRTLARVGMGMGILRQIPDIGEIRALAQMAYKRFDQSGMQVAANAIRNLVKTVGDDLTLKGLTEDLPASALRTLYPNTAAVMSHLANFAKGDQSVASLNNLKQIINDATTGPISKADKRYVRIIGDHIDNFIQNLQPEHLTNPGAFDPKALASLDMAKRYWRTQAKAQTIADLVDKARIRAGQYSVAGMDNALRVQFAQLARNDRGMAQFDHPDERKAIRAIAEGTPVLNVLRWLGKWAPNASSPGGLASSGAAIFGGATHNPLLAVPAAVGIGSKIAARRMRESLVQNALNTVLNKPGFSLVPMRSNLFNTTYGPMIRGSILPPLNIATQNEADRRRQAMAAALMQGGQ